MIWAAANAVKALVAAPAGTLSDRFGRGPVLIVGWSLRIVLLLLLALGAGGNNDPVTWLLFLVYAGALAATEGAERAFIGDCTLREDRGTAFGLYHMTIGLATLPGALIFGSVRQFWGSPAAFLLAATIAALAVAARSRISMGSISPLLERSCAKREHCSSGEI